ASLLHRREGPFHGALKDGYDDLVEHPYTALDQIEMAIRQRVERPRIKRDCHYPPSLTVVAWPSPLTPLFFRCHKGEGHRSPAGLVCQPFGGPFLKLQLPTRRRNISPTALPYESREAMLQQIILKLLYGRLARTTIRQPRDFIKGEQVDLAPQSIHELDQALGIHQGIV